jgi:ABC-type nitrate/sulfonate/bicarbonate transport system permease component
VSNAWVLWRRLAGVGLPWLMPLLALAGWEIASRSGWLSTRVLSAFWALLLGLFTGTFRWAETPLDSTLQMVRNIRALALISLVILWFGIDETAKLFLGAVGVFLPGLPQPLPRHPRGGPGAHRDGTQLWASAAGRFTARSSCRAPCRPSWWACASAWA